MLDAVRPKCVVVATSISQRIGRLFEKGYIGINGCSITLGEITEGRFIVHLIPETLRATNLDYLVYGDQVNLEFDQNTITIVETTERILRDQAK